MVTPTNILRFYRYTGPLALLIALIWISDELLRSAGVEWSEELGGWAMLIGMLVIPFVMVAIPLAAILSVYVLYRFPSDLQLSVPAFFIAVSTACLILALTITESLPSDVVIEDVLLYVGAAAIVLFGAFGTYFGWRGIADADIFRIYRYCGPLALAWLILWSSLAFGPMIGWTASSSTMLFFMYVMIVVVIAFPLSFLLAGFALSRFTANWRIALPASFLVVSSILIVVDAALIYASVPLVNSIEPMILYLSGLSLVAFAVLGTYVGWSKSRLQSTV